MDSIQTDVLVIGAGAAGLMCAIEAGKRGRHVTILEHGRKPAEKIRISGGGRCNFTNLGATPEHYRSQNPRYCVSALARYTPQEFVKLVERHKIAYHEKAAGQLFCDGSSHEIIGMLLEECRLAGVTIALGTAISAVTSHEIGFRVETSAGEFYCESLVVASGGLSIPKMRATGLGYNLARQFGLRIVETEPGLVPFTLGETQLRAWEGLAGVSLPIEVSCGRQSFREAMLFTHRGLSGPAMLQISSFWSMKDELRINLAPGRAVGDWLRESKTTQPHQSVAGALSAMLPKRLAQRISEQHLKDASTARLIDLPDKQLRALGQAIQDWRIVPNGTEGYRTAEVTRGGVDTADLSSKTMASTKVENLYFIGEVVDVTGQLGGYNFQWAWASGYVAGQYA